MVMRRPYAILIKYFKLIHLIISMILGYVFYSSINIYKYLGNVIEKVSYKYDAFDYINYGIFIWIILGMGFTFIVYWLLKFKDKPRRKYVLSLLGYGIILVFTFILFNYMHDLPSEALVQKTIRAYRDIMFITLIIQGGILISMFVSFLGFNIKKFNFDKDMQELNLTSEDNAEVEVNLKVDTTDVMREVRKKKREFGYYYQEHKIIILVILGIISIFIVGKIYNIFMDNFKTYPMGTYIGYNYYTKIDKSYLYEENGKSYIVVSFDVLKRGKKEILNVNNFALKVGNKEYTPNKNICYKYDNVGNCYKRQYVGNTEKNYIVVYEIDKVNIKRAKFIYREGMDNIFRVKLNLEKR